MKKFLLVLFSIIIPVMSFSQNVIIARNCDPNYNYSPDRFAEIYNAGNAAVNLTGWTLENIQGESVKFSWLLSGTINPGETKICGNANTTGQTITPDFTATWIGTSWNGTGGDGTVLKNTSGTVVDSAVQHDATGTFSNKEMKRKLTVTSPTATYDASQWVFSTVNDANDVFPGSHGTVFRTTTSGTLWGTANNWDDEVPTATVDAYIPVTVAAKADGPIASPNVCNNLTIASGGSLSIPVNKALTVNGTLSIDASATPGTLTVSSTSSGNGSLIVDGTVTGNATVQRYIAAYTAGTGAGNGWHEIGCPVQSMNITSSSSFYPGTNDDLYKWDETATDGKNWRNYKASSFNFSAGEGYLVAHNGDITYSYTGTLNTSSVTINSLTTGGTGNGWHLLGNPFPSAIKWKDGNWTLTNVGGVAEIWDEASASYVPVNANDIIPSTNGFFVQVSGGTGSVTIPAAARVHDATNNFKKTTATPTETLVFKITDDANSYSDESILGFKPNATKDWDIAFDAHKLMSMVKTAPQIWTLSKNQKFLVNYLPEPTASEDIPLQFKPGVSTVYHLTFNGVDSFNGTSFVLEDLKTGQKIDLSQQNSYDFSATTDESENRFVLHINGVTGVPSVNKTDGIQVYSFSKTIYLHGQKSLNGKISVFNTLGQKVYEGTLNGTIRQHILLNQRAGIYFVRLEESNRVVTRKVFIQ